MKSHHLGRRQRRCKEKFGLGRERVFSNFSRKAARRRGFPYLTGLSLVFPPASTTGGKIAFLPDLSPMRLVHRPVRAICPTSDKRDRTFLPTLTQAKKRGIDEVQKKGGGSFPVATCVMGLISAQKRPWSAFATNRAVAWVIPLWLPSVCSSSYSPSFSTNANHQSRKI